MERTRAEVQPWICSVVCRRGDPHQAVSRPMPAAHGPIADMAHGHLLRQNKIKKHPRTPAGLASVLMDGRWATRQATTFSYGPAPDHRTLHVPRTATHRNSSLVFSSRPPTCPTPRSRQKTSGQQETRPAYDLFSNDLLPYFFSGQASIFGV